MHTDMLIELVECTLNISFHYLICGLCLTVFSNRIKQLGILKSNARSVKQGAKGCYIPLAVC